MTKFNCGVYFFSILTFLSFNVSAQLISVLDNKGNALPNMVVYLEADDKSKHKVSTQNKVGVMDQINRQFNPHILVVNKASQVNFPNSDSIKHHVYSFSKAKPFELKLYRSGDANPVFFDKPGEIVLGCNIHDWMLGYIYVVDTPFFGKTNEKGSVLISVPDGSYQLKIWHPLLDNKDMDFSQQVTINTNTDNSIIITLKAALKPKFAAYEEDDVLDAY